MYATINGTRIFFDVDGKQFVPDGGVMCEKPVCFVLHGGPGSDHSGYVPALSPLVAHMQLIYIDYRGNGRSDYPSEATYTIAQNVADIESLRDYLGLERIVVLGHSYGGMVAQSYAVAHPARVRALILLATASDHRFLPLAQAALRQRGTPEQIALAEQYLWPGAFPDNDTYRRYYALFAGLYAWKPHDAASFNDALSREILSYRALNRAFSGDLRTFDCTDALKHVTCPALVIGAEHDWITPIECTRVIATHLPHCTTITLADSGHAVLHDQYDAVIDAITLFVRTLPEQSQR
jgi:proline iminopeptidase